MKAILLFSYVLSWGFLFDHNYIPRRMELEELLMIEKDKKDIMMYLFYRGIILETGKKTLTSVLC
jgi:hypothetical protein